MINILFILLILICLIAWHDAVINQNYTKMSEIIQDHPEIRNTELTGYPKPVTYKDGDLRCPECGAYIFDDYDVYMDKHGDVIGCEVCISKTTVYSAYLDDKIQLEE